MKLLTSYPRTISDINDHLKILYNGTVKLAKGNGYFYVYSDDAEMGLYLAKLNSTSIYVFKLGVLTIEEWIKNIENIIDNPANKY